MVNSDEKAACFETVLAAELKEVEKRRKLSASNLTQVVNAEVSDDGEGLYPGRRLGANPAFSFKTQVLPPAEGNVIVKYKHIS